MTRDRRTDLLLLGAVTAVALMMRVAHLGRPGHQVFDESFYASDACTYTVLSSSTCGQTREITFMHPPGGKWIIGAGIQVLGYDPIGWRSGVCLAGVLTVVVTFLLGSALMSQTAATTAALVVALDPLHVVLSRTAMLDAPVTLFATASVLAAVYDRAAGTVRARWLWRPLIGLALGLGIATKWSAVLILPLVVLLVWEGERRRRRTRTAAESRGARQRLIASSSAFSLAVAVLVYLGSYARRLTAPGAWPSHPGVWLQAFLHRQESMARFHLGLDAPLGTHPYASPPWSWPLAKRPPVVAYEMPGRLVQETLALVNPFVTVPAIGLAGLGVLIAFGRRNLSSPGSVFGLGLLLSWLPWVVLASDRSFVFAYYFLPAIPFVGLTLGWGVDVVRRRLGRRLSLMVVVATVGVAATFLAYFWPVLTAEPLPYQVWRRHIVLTDCGSPAPRMQDGRVGPRPGPGGPPAGWCWF